MRPVLDQQHQFGKAVEPDHDRHQRHAFGEIGNAKREAGLAGDRFLADGPSINPSVIGSSAEASVPPEIRDITTRPPAVSAKNSAGPNRIATLAR